MDYSRSIKKASIGRRVVISWLIVAIIFFFIGFCVGKISSTSGKRIVPTEIYSELGGGAVEIGYEE